MRRWLSRLGSLLLLCFELALWVAFGVALFHGQPLPAGLIALGCLAMLWDGVPYPREAIYWLLAAALVVAHRSGEPAVFFLVAPSLLLHNLLTVLLLQIRCGRREWESFFAGPMRLPGWSAFLFRWRQQGRAVHALAWLIVIAIGVAVPAGILWVALGAGSPWLLPYVITAGLLLLWWLALGLREIHIRLTAPSEHWTHREVAGAPREWEAEAARMYVEPTHWPDGRLLPPAALDLQRDFDGPYDPRLRLFAADCAEHAMLAERDAGRKPHGVTAGSINAARKRGRGRLGATLQRSAFVFAAKAYPDAAREASKHGADPASEALADDAACAAYHALCAPTPLAAARLAANCTSVTADGALRDEEHGWQLKRLDWYREQGPVSTQTAK